MLTWQICHAARSGRSGGRSTCPQLPLLLLCGCIPRWRREEGSKKLLRQAGRMNLNKITDEQADEYWFRDVKGMRKWKELQWKEKYELSALSPARYLSKWN